MSATRRMWARRWVRAIEFTHQHKLTSSISDMNLITASVFTVQAVTDVVMLPARLTYTAVRHYAGQVIMGLTTIGVIGGLLVWMPTDAPKSPEPDQVSVITPLDMKDTATIEYLTGMKGKLQKPSCFDSYALDFMNTKKAAVSFEAADMIVETCKTQEVAEAKFDLVRRQREMFTGKAE